jgi:transporter family protein
LNQGIAAALVTHVAYAFGGISSTYAARKISGVASAFWIQIGSLIFAFTPIFFVAVPALNPGIIFMAVVLSILGQSAWLLYNLALEKGNVPLVAAISGAYPAIVVMLSVWFYDESITSLQTLAILLAIVGVVLSSLNFKALKHSKGFRVDSSIVYSVLALLIWGVYFTFIRSLIEQVGWAWANFLLAIFGTIYLTLLVRKKLKTKKIKARTAWKSIITASLLLTFGTLTFNIAIDQGQSSVVVPIVGAYPAMFAVLSYFLFEQKLTRQQLFGVILTLTGVISLVVLSV